MNYLINLKEACLLTGRTKSTLYRWAKNGTLNIYIIDGIKYVDGKELLKVEPNIKPGRPNTPKNINNPNDAKTPEMWENK